MEYKGIPKGQAAWALVLGFAVAVAALFFGLWLISPRQLAQYFQKKPAAPVAMQAPVPPPPPPPPLPAFVVPAQ